MIRNPNHETEAIVTFQDRPTVCGVCSHWIDPCEPMRLVWGEPKPYRHLRNCTRPELTVIDGEPSEPEQLTLNVRPTLEVVR